jgi:hypothetical protein
MGLREVTNMLRTPYKCPLCGENACWGIDCDECKFSSDYACDAIVPCDCDGLNYITEIQRLKDKLNIKETEIISLILHIKILKQQIKDQSKLLDLQDLKINVLKM